LNPCGLVFDKYRKAKQKPVTVEAMNAAIAERFSLHSFQQATN
jgi:hypothetical protein